MVSAIKDLLNVKNIENIKDFDKDRDSVYGNIFNYIWNLQFILKEYLNKFPSPNIDNEIIKNIWEAWENLFNEPPSGLKIEDYYYRIRDLTYIILILKIRRPEDVINFICENIKNEILEGKEKDYEIVNKLKYIPQAIKLFIDPKNEKSDEEIFNNYKLKFKKLYDECREKSKEFKKIEDINNCEIIRTVANSFYIYLF